MIKLRGYPNIFGSQESKRVQQKKSSGSVLVGTEYCYKTTIENYEVIVIHDILHILLTLFGGIIRHLYSELQDGI